MYLRPCLLSLPQVLCAQQNDRCPTLCTWSLPLCQRWFHFQSGCLAEALVGRLDCHKSWKWVSPTLKTKLYMLKTGGVCSFDFKKTVRSQLSFTTAKNNTREAQPFVVSIPSTPNSLTAPLVNRIESWFRSHLLPFSFSTSGKMTSFTSPVVSTTVTCITETNCALQSTKLCRLILTLFQKPTWNALRADA